MKQVCGYGKFGVLGKAQLLQEREGKNEILVGCFALGFGGQFAGRDTPLFHPLQHGFGLGDLLSSGLPSGKDDSGLGIVPQVFLGSQKSALQKP